MSVSKIDLLNKRFSRGVLGYSRNEVDQFLVEVAETIGAMADRQKELKRKVKDLESSVAEYRQRDETLRDTLMNTQKVVDDIKVGADREARLILEEAKAKADSMVRKGHERLAQIHEEVESVKKQRARFEVQLKSLLESHLSLLEYSDPEAEKFEELESKLKYLKKAE